MNEFDEFSENLLEESLRFLEKAKQSDNSIQINAYLHASLVLGFSSLEAYVNSICDEILLKQVPLIEKSILSEKEIILDNDQFKISNKLKIYRLEDRIKFLYKKFSGNSIDENSEYWSDLKSGTNLRNQVTHPKEKPKEFTEEKVSRALMAIIGTINQLCQVIYKKPFPKYKKGLDSNLDF